MSFSSKSLESDGAGNYSTSDNRINEMVENSDENNDEPLDPRIQVKYILILKIILSLLQIELERANAATSEINNLETQLDVSQFPFFFLRKSQITLQEAQQIFQTSFANCKQCLAVLAKKLGGCVERARPFFEACKQAEEVNQSKRHVYANRTF